MAEARPPPRVLVVDDEPDIVQSLHEWLSATVTGVTFETATEPEQALRRIAEWKPHVVITDYRMPRMDGVQLAEACPQPRPRFVLITGYPGADVDRRAYDAGVDLILSKPVDARALAKVVGQLANAAARQF